MSESEAQDEDSLAFEAVGDHALVPQASVELAVNGLGVASVGVDQLVGEGLFGDLLGGFGAMEVTLDIAEPPFAGRAIPG
ncbi:hypothetical protein HUF15_31860 [Streptomyces samsunensis]|uniref:hypothetical protein n=1 Tax=Streptomyces malaysiensis TaxID=92644 RepID=UPI001584486C|nr:hypothetical protein [Streptomyces samsunensis]NUH41282.1 hypothetical protein [Streptomyces samsunensis]